jgi:putative pyoverdin transport system ATP-binding/permease protein
MGVLFLLWRYSKASVVGAIAAGFAGGLCNALLLVIMNAAWRGDAGRNVLALAFAGCCAVMVSSRLATNLLLNGVATRAVMAMRLDLLRRVLATPLRQIERVGAPRVLTSLTGDAGTIIDAAATLPYICWNAAVLVAGFGYLAWLSPALFAGVAAVIVLGSSIYRLIMRGAAHRFGLGRVEWDHLFDLLRSSVAGIKELQLHRARRLRFVDDVAESSARYRTHSRDSLRLHSLGVSWGHSVMFTLLGLLVFVVPALGGAPQATIVAYSMVLLYVLNPLDGMMSAIPSFARAGVAAKRIEELGLSLATPLDDTRVRAASETWTQLELIDVIHDYPSEEGGRFRLGPVSLGLRPGEVLFISGGNGSGKSTLAKVLTGLYLPDSGEIRVNGCPVREAEVSDYREHFSTVFFDFHLFDRLLGLDPGQAAERGTRLLRELRLEGKVTVTERGFSTTQLSQGQRKRLALLVAYLEDRPIYVFDEWAADQDPGFKEVFYYEILPALRRKGKGVVVISHDDRYFPVADRLIHLENGTIAYETARDDSAAPLVALAGTN